MNKNYLLYLFIFTCCALLISCGGQEKQPAANNTISIKKPVVMDPFRYHKLIEVSPGQDYDILSWGRGSSTIGAFEILHSDSAAGKYTTTTGDLDGAIVDVYNSDMDLDGNPEILIQAKGKDTTNHANIYAFEFNNNKAEKLDFPKLTKSQREGYRGDDNFYIKDGMLIREFPLYDGNGKDAKLTGQKRQLQYGLRNNNFTVKQIGKDSTAGNTTINHVKSKQVVQHNTTNQSSSNNGKSSAKRSKKHAAEKHHKKKRRRHHSDEG